MRRDAEQNSLKNREAFTKQALKMGMPSSLFMLGVLLCFGSYFFSKTFFVPLVVGGFYFPLMFRIHRVDSRGFSVWWSCYTDNSNGWQAGSINEIDIEVIQNKE